MKVRLVGGPHGGKTMKVGPNYQSELSVDGPKRMSRQEKYAHQAKYYDDFSLWSSGRPYRVPQVRARYKLEEQVIYWRGQMMSIPCMHPDGSFFYKYVEGSRKDF